MPDTQPPEACTSLADIRAQIDRLDRHIVRLLAERGAYVLAAAPFKRDAAAVAAPERVEQVIAQVRAVAQAEGALPEVVERIYRELIAAYTDAEHRRWLQQQPRP
jgi:isochorismate pyruvate lyase